MLGRCWSFWGELCLRIIRGWLSFVWELSIKFWKKRICPIEQIFSKFCHTLFRGLEMKMWKFDMRRFERTWWLFTQSNKTHSSKSSSPTSTTTTGTSEKKSSNSSSSPSSKARTNSTPPTSSTSSPTASTMTSPKSNSSPEKPSPHSVSKVSETKFSKSFMKQSSRGGTPASATGLKKPHARFSMRKLWISLLQMTVRLFQLRVKIRVASL